MSFAKQIHQIKLRKERQQQTIMETEQYLEAISKLPNASTKALGATRAKLLRQRAALRVTTEELAAAQLLEADPAQVDLDAEIAKNEQEAAAKVGRASRRS